jgi:hypothetical protein
MPLADLTGLDRMPRRDRLSALRRELVKTRQEIDEAARATTKAGAVLDKWITERNRLVSAIAAEENGNE